MPYITRDMANFLHKNDHNQTSASDIQHNGPKSDSDGRKLRDQPLSVVPISSNLSNDDQSKSSRLSRQSVSSCCESMKSNRNDSKNRSLQGPSLTTGSNASNTINKQLSLNQSRNLGRKSSKSSKSSNTIGDKYENKNKNLSFNEKMIKYAMGLLRSNITKLMDLDGSVNIQHSKEFKAYRIDYDSQLISQLKNCDRLVKAVHKNTEFKEFPLCCKIYDLHQRTSMDPEKSDYLRILRSLARKHPSIIQTWGVFYDPQQQRILVIQEYLVHGSLERFLVEKNHPCFPERKVSEIAQQIAMALDFLGDMGISHRSLSPRYVMIAHRDPIRVKLAGFRSAIIYWDIQRENVNLVPCIALKDKPTEPDFQAPEVYGDPQTEAFDPIHADIWSFGATIYFLLSKRYPYDFSRENPKIEEEIQTNVEQLSKISRQCQRFLSSILCTSSEQRMKFDRLTSHPWIMK